MAVAVTGGRVDVQSAVLKHGMRGGFVAETLGIFRCACWKSQGMVDVGGACGLAGAKRKPVWSQRRGIACVSPGEGMRTSRCMRGDDRIMMPRPCVPHLGACYMVKIREIKKGMMARYGREGKICNVNRLAVLFAPTPPPSCAPEPDDVLMSRGLLSGGGECSCVITRAEGVFLVLVAPLVTSNLRF